MTLIDTNVVLRYLLNDIESQAETAEKIIKEGAFTLPEIIAEVVYVLVKVYEIPRAEIQSILIPFLNEINIDNKNVINSAVELFSSTSFDFVDCILIARKLILNENIFTFDKKLSNKLK